ncbi:hypothetical protein LEP1GSC046_0584 [Leptospira kirschneri serovar Bim str. 1051]|nr:hypothetical protein LEP1GSC042_3123 [Leptospira kirschneri serovar Bim str. PUO 1247]EMN03807.1 hypothetical protein LEP1GSC046_0584 [Leptospira kirschneri serovar Bim str. 1051]
MKKLNNWEIKTKPEFFKEDRFQNRFFYENKMNSIIFEIL